MQENIEERIDRAMEKVISDPLHGQEFYKPEDKMELKAKIKGIIEELKITDDMPDFEKIKSINDYMKKNVRLRASYFNAMKDEKIEISPEEIPYRTGHAALTKGEGICVAYAEGARLLLESVRNKYRKPFSNGSRSKTWKRRRI